LNQIEAGKIKALAVNYVAIIDKITSSESLPPPSLAAEDGNNGMIRFALKLQMYTPLDSTRNLG